MTLESPDTSDRFRGSHGLAHTGAPTVDPESFARACAIRGVSGADLRRIGGFSKATLANLRAGRPVRPGTLLRLNATLGRFPVLDDLPELLMVPSASDGRR
jgi:hypothetical protein